MTDAGKRWFKVEIKNKETGEVYFELPVQALMTNGAGEEADRIIQLVPMYKDFLESVDGYTTGRVQQLN